MIIVKAHKRKGKVIRSHGRVKNTNKAKKNEFINSIGVYANKYQTNSKRKNTSVGREKLGKFIPSNLSDSKLKLHSKINNK